MPKLLIPFIAALSAAAVLHAQDTVVETEAATSLPAETGTTPAADPSLELMPNAGAPGASTIEPLPLMPEAPAPRPSTGAAEEKPAKEKKSQTEAASDELRQRIRFREARNRALKDPAVQAEWTFAHRVKTDFEKRESLTRYYKLLFARMLKIDKALQPQVAEAQKRSLNRLRQARIDPTEPLDAEARTERFTEE